ncbi:MAG TPA: hypothetical protein VGM91_19740 [Conexibacter sp.]|jgi:hypothetical protein
MKTITSSEQLLALPVHERQTLMVLPDKDLREIEQLASTQQTDQLEIEQAASTDQVPKLLELAVGLAGAVDAPKAAGAAVDRAREIVRAGASRAAATPPRMAPALALGVVGIGVAAFVFKSRNSNPNIVTIVAASAAQGLTFSEGPFELGGVYTAHPIQHERYLPAASFARIILEERTRETQTFLMTCCGASKVEMTIDHSDDLGFAADAGYEERPRTDSGKLNAKRSESTKRRTVSEGPGRSAPIPLIPSEWIWFAAEPEWQEIHRQRRDAGITSYDLTTEFNDDRSVDFKALAKIPGVKLNAGVGAKRLDKTIVTWKVSFPTV